MSRFKKNISFILLIVLGGSIFWLLGSDVTKNTDNYVYDLPFAKGSSHKIIQGYGGWFSHKNIAALDFYMPVGTPVYAAREGIVFGYKNDNNEGGPLPKFKNKANYIIIKHTDGSFGCYWHLQQNGVVTKKGFVKKGGLIGYSGNSGFVVAAHLHFSVKAKLNYDKDAFVKTKFNTASGVLLLKRGKAYGRPL